MQVVIGSIGIRVKIKKSMIASVFFLVFCIFCLVPEWDGGTMMKKGDQRVEYETRVDRYYDTSE